MIQYRVQNSPGRDTSLARLLAGLPADTEVITDIAGPPASPWRGFKPCLQNPPPGTTHIAVFQDDGVACQNLSQTLEQIVTAQPDAVICLFFPGSARNTYPKYIKALATGERYVPLSIRDFMPVVATVWPVDLARDFLEWSEDAKLPGMPREVRSDDAVCGLWQRMTRSKVLVTVPSLIQHPDDVESTIGKRASAGADKSRVAVQYINGDPLEIDWS